MDDDAWFGIVSVIIILALVGGYSIWFAHMEAAAYNRITGKSVRWQDAVFVELRVQEPAQ